MRSRFWGTVLCMMVWGLPVVWAAGEGVVPDMNLRVTKLEYFDLYSEFEISKQDLLDVRRHLTNARRMVGQDLGQYPEHRFDVILSTKKTFHAYSGLPDTVAGLFDARIHIPVPSVLAEDTLLKAIVWHEYTHGVIYLMSQGRCPSWLNEGLAVYEESRVKRPSVDLLKEHLAESGTLAFKMGDMSGIIENIQTRDARASALVYQQAYLFVDYLYSRFSRKTVRDFIKEFADGTTIEEAISKVLHLKPETLEERWLAHIQKFLTNAS